MARRLPRGSAGAREPLSDAGLELARFDAKVSEMIPPEEQILDLTYEIKNGVVRVTTKAR